MAKHRLLRGALTSQWGDAVWVLGSVGALVGVWLLCLRDVAPPVIPDGQVDADLLSTLLEVIPAVVVAVAIFSAGTIFVIAQMIGTSLGSRAVLSLLTHNLARGGVIAGVVLLLASLLTTAFADVPDGASEEPSGRLAAWGTALALGTAVYVVLSMTTLVGVVWTFVDPGAYSESLSGAVRGATRRDRSDDLYERVRALRQWLRTAASSGESRDLVLALVGLERLLLTYRKRVITPRDGVLRELAPREYVSSHLSVQEQGMRSASGDDAPPSTDASGALRRWVQRGLGRPTGWQCGWVGNEVGRALVRGLEVGIQGQCLRRDADRILQALRVSLDLMLNRNDSDAGGRSGEAVTGATLAEEVAYLLDRLAEMSMLVEQFDDQRWVDWFDRPADALARMQCRLESLPQLMVEAPLAQAAVLSQSWSDERLHPLVAALVRQVPRAFGRRDGRRLGEQAGAEPAGGQPASPPEEHSLAARALADWCVVQFVRERQRLPLTSTDELGPDARTGDAALWAGARALLQHRVLLPTWLKGGATMPEDVEAFMRTLEHDLLKRAAARTGSRGAFAGRPDRPTADRRRATVHGGRASVLVVSSGRVVVRTAQLAAAARGRSAAPGRNRTSTVTQPLWLSTSTEPP